MAELPPQVEVVIVQPPRLAPLGGEAAFDAVQIDSTALQSNPRLDEALKRAPGVSLFRRNGSEGANPTTQGLSLRSIAPSGAGRALVTLDGAPVNDPFGGWVIWTALPPESLEGASILRGAGAGPYGAGALTGVVALQEAAAGHGLSAVNISAAERGGYRAAVVGGGPGILVSASTESSDGYRAVRGARQGAADQPLKLKASSFAFRAQQEVDGVEMAARLGAFEERRGAGLVGARSIASGASATFTLARRAEEGVGGWRLQLWGRGSNLANSSVAVAANRAAPTPANDQYATPAWGLGVNAAVQGRMGEISWEAGADARTARGIEKERFRYMNGFTRNREAGGRTQVAGLYLETAVNGDPWLLTGGIRVDAWRADKAVRREYDTANGALLLNQSSPSASGTTPTARVGLRYAVNPQLWLRTAAYAGFRPPTLNELHRPFRVGNDITEANPTLKPETLRGAEVGLGGEVMTVRWSSTVFYNLLKDPIANVTIGSGPGTFPTAGFVPAGGTLRQRQNAGEIEAWGLEGEAAADVGSTLTLRAAFAATRAEVNGGTSAPQLTGLRPAQTPKWTVTGGGDWRATDRLTLSGDVRYESKRFEDDLNSRVLGAGVEVDARAGWRIAPGSEVYLAVENLANEKLETGETADGVSSFSPPRTFRIGFSYRR